MPTETRSDDAREAIGLDSGTAETSPFSPVLRWRDLLFVSGQVAVGDDGTLVDGGIVEQTERVLANLATALEHAGSGLDRLLKCTIYLADLDDWEAMTEVWVRRIGLPRPARCAIGARLPDGMLLEVEAIAAAPAGAGA